jgi:hypothetical protein
MLTRQRQPRPGAKPFAIMNVGLGSLSVESFDEGLGMSEEAATDAQMWAAACEDALIALQDALTWELSEPAWGEVASAISDMARAIAGRDADLLIQATSSLELCSPLRVGTRAGGHDNRESTPVTVKEQVAHTVKDLNESTQNVK